MHAWGETLRLHARARAKDDAQPKALACYGLLRTDQDRVLLRFVEGRPVSRVTTDFLAWGAGRLAAEGKRVWVLVWDNAAWHVRDRKSIRLNSSHANISYAVFCLKK